MTHEERPVEPATAGLSRRSVVRTAAHAAWATPVIVAVSAAPSVAASGPAAVTTVVTAAGVSGTVIRTIAIASTLTNVNASASTALTVSLVVTLANDSQWGVAVIPPTASAAGYSVTGPTTPSSGTRSWVFTAAAQIVGNSTKAFDPTVTIDVDVELSGTVTVLPSPGGLGTGTGGSRTIV